MRALLILTFVLAISLLAMTVYSHGLRQEKDALSHSRDALILQLSQRDSLITALNQQMQQREQAELALRDSLSLANSLTAQREQQFQRSRNEDPSVKKWAEGALPAAVSQLHQRPAFASATDYLRGLSARQRLPDTSQPPPK